MIPVYSRVLVLYPHTLVIQESIMAWGGGWRGGDKIPPLASPILPYPTLPYHSPTKPSTTVCHGRENSNKRAMLPSIVVRSFLLRRRGRRTGPKNLLFEAKLLLLFFLKKTDFTKRGNSNVLAHDSVIQVLGVPYPLFEFASAEYPCELRHQPKSV